MFMASRAILSNFFEEQWTRNHPQYLSGLLRALLSTIFLKIAVYADVVSNPCVESHIEVKGMLVGKFKFNP